MPNRSNRDPHDREYKTPWILRDFSGAPGWAIILFGLIVAGIAVLAVLRP